jgi:hypothetical protein
MPTFRDARTFSSAQCWVWKAPRSPTVHPSGAEHVVAIEQSPFVEASFYLLLRIDRSFVTENGENGHISKDLRLD